MQNEPSSEERVIRLSLFWLLLCFLGITFLGILGGAIGQQLIQQPAPLLSRPTERMVTTVQEVTISPSMAANNLVANNERSILAIVEDGAGETVQMLATGLVVTSDGLMVAPGRLGDNEIKAIDYEGKILELTPVGVDSMFDLSYWRINDGVFVPLELRREDAPVATDLLALSRSKTTFLNKAVSFRINQYELPDNETPIGAQRIMTGEMLISDEELAGSPLLDDDGKIAGVLLSSSLNTALPSAALRISMDRMINEQHELNPFEITGITPRYGFEPLSEDDRYGFSVTVAAVAPRSPAADAGVLPGDIIAKIGDDNVRWSNGFIKKLSQSMPFPVTVLRDQEEHTLTLNEIEE